ncbi:hypothetical protein [Pseudomarimonas salicorniae]|uniref:Uncharacterized protein n=1 Tax=Pseudomarimonas salicorniae TaxID=2933270 RepID=A0ABT0GEP1_9GAMM|nr:hypothetical protein [Lysobacter sp. CAU 1642]MCK7593018.1 hypothetical protein [Lysobacter sp. CAU 1642]
MSRYFLAALALSTFTPAALSGPPGQWDSAQISTVRPLEIKMAGLSTGRGTLRANGQAAKGDNLDDFGVWLSVVLSSSGGQNRIDAITTPPPFDGTGTTSTFIDSSATLFAVGDICARGNTAVVPYIKDFNVEVAHFNGSVWSTQTIPGTTASNYTTADCGRTTAGYFITAQDFNDSEIEIFHSPEGGSDYTFYGRYADARGPFSGAVRDQLATDPRSPQAAILSQQSNGQIRITSFDTRSPFPPAPTHTNIVNLGAPPGSFTIVRESSAARVGDGVFTFLYNADDLARTINFDTGNPSGFTAGVLGAVNSSAGQYTFQGGTAIHVPGSQPRTNLIFDDFFQLDEMGASVIDPLFPLDGVGGPIDGCLATFNPQQRKTYFTGPDATGQNTRLFSRTELPPEIFSDGFESGDVSAWSCN